MLSIAVCISTLEKYSKLFHNFFLNFFTLLFDFFSVKAVRENMVALGPLLPRIMELLQTGDCEGGHP